MANMKSSEIVSPGELLLLAGQTRGRKRLRHEFMSELLGCAVVILFGNGVVAAWTVIEASPDWEKSHQQPDPYAKALYTNLAWGFGVTFGVMVSFNTSGGVLNAALQLSAMSQGACSWGKGLLLIVAQTLGYFLGALLVSVNFVLLKKDVHLVNFYCTHPGPGVSFLNAGVNEFLATMLLSMCLAGITNRRPAFDKFHVAGFAGFLVFAIGQVFGAQSGYAINPARDFGPRMCYLILALIYGGVPIWDEVLGQGYFIVPIVAPCLGALVGRLLYQHLIFLEPLESDSEMRLVNKYDSERADRASFSSGAGGIEVLDRSVRRPGLQP